LTILGSYRYKKTPPEQNKAIKLWWSARRDKGWIGLYRIFTDI